MPAAAAIVGIIEAGSAISAAGGFAALMAGTATFSLTTGLAAVGGVMTTVGALSGDNSLMKIGGLVSVAGGISGLVDSLGTPAASSLPNAISDTSSADTSAISGAADSSANSAPFGMSVDTNAVPDALKPQITGQISDPSLALNSSSPSNISDITGSTQIPNMNTPPPDSGILSQNAPAPAATAMQSSAPAAPGAPGAPTPDNSNLSYNISDTSTYHTYTPTGPNQSASWLDTLYSKWNSITPQTQMVAGQFVQGAMNYMYPTPVQQAYINSQNLQRDQWNAQQSNMAGRANITTKPAGILASS